MTDANTEVKKDEEQLTPKKKRAMLEYMAIMFAVAFLLVAISLLVKVDAMQDDLDKAGAGASLNISLLEEKVDTLKTEKSELESQLSDTERALKAAELLALAQEAHRTADSVAFRGYMAELEGYSDALSAETAEIYHELTNRLSR